MKDGELIFLEADDDQIDDLMVGRFSGLHKSQGFRGLKNLKSGRFGVVARSDGKNSLVQPLALIVDEKSRRKFFGRYSSVRTDLSPISTWCHVFDSRIFEALGEVKREPWLAGFEASWSGLAIGEASLLARRLTGKLKVAGCLATASFAVARSAALWPNVSTFDVVDKHVACNRIVRGTESSASQLTRRFMPVWEALLQAAEENYNPQRRVTRAIQSLRHSRLNDSEEEHLALYDALGHRDEFNFLQDLASTGPEKRIKIFDQLIESLDAKGNDSEHGETAAFVAAYIATIAAGGLPSIGIAEQVSDRWPEVLAWAYVIGGVGEHVTWTSSFDGLGRLVCRELMRPFYIDEAPFCDFSYDEASVLVDRQLTDPLAHLRIKQQRSVSVALFPGVNIAVPLPDFQETSTQTRSHTNNQSSTRSDRELRQLMSALWPLIDERLKSEGYSRSARSVAKRKKRTQGNLPLDK